MGPEGIVSKRADQPYRAGKNIAWIKAKCAVAVKLNLVHPFLARRRYLPQRWEARLDEAGKRGRFGVLDHPGDEACRRAVS